MATRRPTVPDRERAKSILNELWEEVLETDKRQATPIISSLINSNEASIRFCLPTQLLGKLADHNLDALCLQRGDGSDGRWDPRSFAARVIVPWNRANQSVLGSGADPYVSNPLRRPRVDHGLEQMAHRDEWDQLCCILREVEGRNDISYTHEVFLGVLSVIRDRLREFTFSYIVPERVSLQQAEAIVTRFLSERSGGDRGLAIAAALFETIRDRFGIYREIRRGVINAADAATKSAGDLECLGADGQLLLAVEVKERRIGDDDIHIAVAKAREFSVRELIFCCDGIVASERPAVEKTLASVWASGTSVYQLTIRELMRGVLPLTGEAGIRTFISQIGRQLDAFGTQPRHRRAWKAILDAIDRSDFEEGEAG